MQNRLEFLNEALKEISATVDDLFNYIDGNFEETEKELMNARKYLGLFNSEIQDFLKNEIKKEK